MSEGRQPSRWSQLSDEQKAKLEERIRAVRRDQTRPNIIQPRPQGSTIPLSFTQERLWFLDQLEPGTIIYNRPWALRFSGKLNLPVLETCLNEIVRRHEALRTTFSSSEGKPYQIVQPFQEFELPSVDLSRLPKEDRESKALQICQKETLRPFDLDRDMMLRPFLIRMDSNNHLLLLTTHHIAFDGWSERILLLELAKLYETFIIKKSSPLPEPLIQFPDYAYWEKFNLQEDALNQLADFWKKELQDAPPLLKLRTDQPRPSVQTYKGASRSIQIDEDLTQSIKTLSQAEDATLYMTLLSAFKIVLFLHSGLKDIIIGTPIAGRKYRELEKIIGFFVNTLVIRTNLDGDPTFRQLLHRVRSRVLTAFDHQDLPFDKLVEIINPPRDLSFSPIVQVTFALRNIPITNTSFPECQVSEYKFDSGIARFDLGMEVEENQGGLSSSVYFNQDLFDAETVDSLLEQFRDILHAFTLNLDQKLSALPVRPQKPISVRKPIPSIMLDDDLYEKSNLTGTQLLTWIGHKLRPNEPMYNLVYIFTIHGELNPQHFQSAFQTLISGCDALRTIILEEKGVPRRVIHEDISYSIKVIDFSEEQHPETTFNEWIENQAELPFDFAIRLFDTNLIKLSNTKWGWYLKLHHIIADNWSVRVIFQRMQLLYENSLKDCLKEIPTFPQFEDYVSRERAHRDSAKFIEAENYWTQKFSTPVQQPIFYGIHNLRKTTCSERVSLDIGKERTEKLRKIASHNEFFIKSEDASLLNIFSTLFFAYLYRSTGNRDLTLAISFHNRHNIKERQTIGLFMESLPLRITINDHETFRSLYKQVTSDTVETLQHRRFPIRNPVQSPIYEIAINFQRVTYSKFIEADVEYKRVNYNYNEEPLSLFIRDYTESGSFTIDFDLNCDIFPPNIRNYVVQHFERFLDTFLLDPDTPIDQVELLNVDERKHLLLDLNETTSSFPTSKTIHQLFEEQVKLLPDQIAVISGDRSLTYHQLNSHANQLAHHLHSLDLHPEDHVGVLVDRSIEMLVAVLGTLKAGGSYVPLDPNLPQKRLESILADSHTNFVLTKDNLLDRLPKIKGHVVTLDSWETFSAQSVENPIGGANPDHLAYVIFTSGTTGVPKGVMVEHQSLVNFTHWAGENWSLNPDDRVLQFTSFSWDTHIEEIFPALTRGSTIILRTENMMDTFQGFLESCQSLGITVMDIPTAFWHDLTTAIATERLELPNALRLMIIGGERVLKDHVDTWFRIVDREIRLVNTYGLTECTCISTQYDLTEEFSPETTRVPIGKPINNVQTYVLDHHRKSLPFDLPGELWIGGISLARGYLNQHELTQERFVDNFLEGTPGDRLLRTGDLARLLTDGNLEILGRIDQQVKIRGHRIELEEIEAALNEHPAVHESIVVAIGDISIEDHPTRNPERLVAYYIPNLMTDHEYGSIDFRIFLQQKLPEYMIPSAYMTVESFRLTPSGKVDRDSLPTPDFKIAERDQTYHPPSTELEHQLIAIWEDVLQVKPIGIMDDFFELGGHSLLAVRLFSLIEKRIGVKIPLLSLFEAPNIYHQAEIILGQHPEKQEPKAVAVETNGTRPPFFCVSPSVIDVLTYRELSRNMGQDQPFYALYSPRLGDWRESTKLREEIADQFIDKIQEIDPEGPYFIGGYSAGGAIALEIAQRMKNQGCAVGLLVLFDTFGPHYPVRLPWVTPRMFNAFLVIRRIESYLWKFWLLDWKGKLNYLRIPRIRSWLRDRYGEVRPSIPSRSEYDTPKITWGHRNYNPEIYDGDVLLIRAKKGLLGIRQDPKMGWGDTFTGNFEIFMVPGDHEAILFGPRAKNVAQKLNASFASVLRSLE